MSTRSKAQQNIRSTDRAGVFMLSLAVILITVGVCFMLGISAPTTTRSLSFFKSVVIGLAGNLYLPLPFLLIAMGVVFAVSSKRRVSLKAIFTAFSLYICILAFITLISTVTGYGTLMDYTLNLNIHYIKHTNPTSYGAYLSAAFAQFGGRATPLPGGGWIGMLLAFPLWKLLGRAGGITLMVLAVAVLFFALIGFNPIIFMQNMSDKRRLQDMQSIKQNTAMQEAQAKDTAGTHQATFTQTKDGNDYQQQPMWEAPPVQESLFKAPVMDPNAFYQEETTEQMGFKPVQDNMDNFYNMTGEQTRRSERTTEKPVRQETKPIDIKPEPVKYEPTYKKPLTQNTEPQNTKQTPKREPVHQDFEDISAERNEDPVNITQTIEQPVSFVQEPMQERVIETKPLEKNIYNKPLNSDLQQEKTPPKKGVETPKETFAVKQDVNAEIIPPKPLVQIQKPQASNTKKDNEQLSFVPEFYDKPPERLLSSPPVGDKEETGEEDLKRAEKLEQTLDSFNIPATVQQIVHGPAITRFAIRLGEGVNVNKIRNVLDNLSLELLAKAPVRAEIPIPGTPLVGIEVANDKAETVYLKEVLFSQKLLNNNSPTTVALGKDITGTPILCDLSNMPHLLIAGATGSGKSVCINSIITSLLYRARPDEVRLILVDPKFVELQPYNACPHLLLPVITDVDDASAALEWLCDEMDDRYLRMQKSGARNIIGYNKRLEAGEEKMPYIVVIIDEMADLILTSGKEVEEYIKRITAKARAAGICLILATQRPSVNVITGVIKANIPSRIAFQVSSQVDSRTILDSVGAEKLLGYGDMLYMPRTSPAPSRVQGCFISDRDVEAVTEYVKSRNQTEYNVDLMEHIEDAKKQENKGPDYYNSENPENFDELLPDAIEMAVESGQTSISMLQRVLRVGYGRAGRLVDEMERRGIIGPSEGTKPRVTLMTREEFNRLVEAGDDRVR
ncbi:MAG: DNA translocase FtsK [Eubacteriales bacterium]|nr:DNA translocase FtsK [Eubacteriales bacterium]